jgi:hypothetical protein
MPTRGDEQDDGYESFGIAANTLQVAAAATAAAAAAAAAAAVELYSRAVHISFLVNIDDLGLLYR